MYHGVKFITEHVEYRPGYMERDSRIFLVFYCQQPHSNTQVSWPQPEILKFGV
jgi:hypothetical protein